VVSRGPLALPTTRDAEPFELLRDRADAMEAAGRRPTVVLATLGSPAAHGPRALFAATFFAAGGIATQTLPVDAGCATYDPAVTPVVCVCAPDAMPDATAAEAVRRLREAGARRVLLAGKPALADRLGDALVDGFVHQGCDMLSVLSGVLSDDEAHRTPN
jgi:methylmalonyl-CoA mutase